VKKRSTSRHVKTNQGRGSEEMPAKITPQTVLIVDDDESVLSALARRIRSAGFKVRSFSHPRALLDEQLPTRNTCLIADIYLPEMTGDKLCHTLAVSGHPLPTILITGRDDETTRYMGERSEVIAVLFKPIDEVILLDAISRCFRSQPGDPV
jgi:two-component system, LuxR family, response regulator FixJ